MNRRRARDCQIQVVDLSWGDYVPDECIRLIWGPESTTSNWRTICKSHSHPNSFQWSTVHTTTDHFLISYRHSQLFKSRRMFCFPWPSGCGYQESQPRLTSSIRIESVCSCSASLSCFWIAFDSHVSRSLSGFLQLQISHTHIYCCSVHRANWIDNATGHWSHVPLIVEWTLATYLNDLSVYHYQFWWSLIQC